VPASTTTDGYDVLITERHEAQAVQERDVPLDDRAIRRDLDAL
jgi:hypothetical protein